MISNYCDRWRITLEPILPEISYNLVLFGISEQFGPVAIKTSPPHEEFSAETEVLRTNQIPGIVRLFDSDPSVAIMLQQRIIPGTSLKFHANAGEFDDEGATAIAAACMKRFWSPDPHSPHLITLDQWFKALYAYRDHHITGGGRIPSNLLELAIHHADHLLATEQDRYTVHGDLNPGNILRNQFGDWTIIDPKGLVAERGYDIGQWMINPCGLHTWPNLGETLDRRLTQFSNVFDIDRYRLWQWAIAHSVLSECWTLEDAVDSEGLHALDIARALSELPEANR